MSVKQNGAELKSAMGSALTRNMNERERRERAGTPGTIGAHSRPAYAPCSFLELQSAQRAWRCS